jgi:hypothetical protein
MGMNLESKSFCEPAESDLYSEGRHAVSALLTWPVNRTFGSFTLDPICET